MPRSEERKPKSREPLPPIVASGFFVLRTPLLPFDEYEAWSDGLSAPSAFQEGNLEGALARDRSLLRQRLREILARPEVQEALFVASPSLDENLQFWWSNPASERGQKAERSLVRYFTRMCARATPFGLFAGCSVGTVDASTRLELQERSSYQRHTRLDMDYLTGLTQELLKQPAAQSALLYRPNSSLYRAGGRLRYVESRLDHNARSYHLAAVEPTDYLLSTITRASDGATLSDLAHGLRDADPEVSPEEANEYLTELIDNQLLVADFGLPVTGPEPTDQLIAQMRAIPNMRVQAEKLEQTQTAIAELDARGLGAERERYRAIAKGLEELPAKVELPRLFQVDLHQPTAAATLGREVIEEVSRAVALLHRISPKRSPGALERFRDAFRKRYENREMPLVEVLDEELGIGFDASTAPSSEGSPLLEGLLFPPIADEGGSWSSREAFLLSKVSQTLSAGKQELELSSSDLASLENKDPPPLPDAFMVIAKVFEGHDFRVMVSGANGPSGAKLLGRFCHGDPSLRRLVEQHLRAEEALRPDALFAEIVHLPEGRLGNILLRPVLRKFEIPYLGLSGAPRESQIPVGDLLVSLVGSRVVLRSTRLKREIVPRLTSAHNYGLRSLGVYRFLCALQAQGVASGLGFGWGALDSAPFLPRVVSGRTVLSKARWGLRREQLLVLGEVKSVDRYRAAQKLREELRLPRFVFLSDADNTLLVDLDNALSVDTFSHLAKGRAFVRLEEFFPGRAELSVRGPEGRFLHELIIPFTRKEGARQVSRLPASVQGAAARSFHPGSSWLYAKLYTGTSGVDQLLRSVVGPLVSFAIGSGAADGWFFVRYGDPEWHLRLRFWGKPERLHAEVLPRIQREVAPLLNTGEIWRFQLDTYERELERYGGPAGMAASEKVFQLDSEAALRIVELLSGDQGADARWRLSIRGMDMLLQDLRFDLASKLKVVKAAREAFGKEFRVDGNFEHQLGEKYRQNRAIIEDLLAATPDPQSPLVPGFEVLQKRSDQLESISTELFALEKAGRLQTTILELAPSYLHMHANRMLRSAARAQELVIYDFLTRTYESRLARERKGSSRTEGGSND